MPKVFSGVDELIDTALRISYIGAAPHYAHRQAALNLRSKPGVLDASRLLKQIIRQIESNLDAPDARWRIKGASEQNWRWKQYPDYTRRQQMDEKTVERLIVSQCGDCWANQVPTASGLMDAYGEKLCNIDLVCKVGKNAYEFIELKNDNSTPLFAAFEAIKYLMLFLVSRCRRDEFKYSIELNPLLWANSVRTVVLALPEYYVELNLKWLEDELVVALSALSDANLALGFTFERMERVCDGDAVAAIRSRRRVYGC